MRRPMVFFITLGLIAAQATAVGAQTGSDCELLVNGGFEEPDVGTRYKIVAASSVPGWGTTAADGRVELWADGFLGVPGVDRGQFTEVNANRPAMIYQDVASTPGETLTWSFWHRGRATEDTVEVKIGAPGDSLSVQETVTTEPGAWVEYRGSYTVPSGQTTTRFGIEAIDSGSVGNLLDEVSLTTECAPAATTTTNPPTTTTVQQTTSTTSGATTTTGAVTTTTTVPPPTTTTTVVSSTSTTGVTPPDPDMDVILLTDTTSPVAAGTAVWVALNWTAEGGDATTFQATASATGGVTVSYPENTVDHTSLYQDDELSDAELDFTALHLDVPFDVVGPIELTINLTYDTANGPIVQVETVTVPILVEEGDGLEQTTVDLGTIPGGQAEWVDVWFTGLAAAVGEVEMVVDEPGRFGITYPAEGSFTSLYYSNSIRRGESDVARFRLDTSGVPAGTYELDLRTTYLVGGEGRTLEKTVSVTVADTGSPTSGMLVVSDFAERTDPVALQGAALSGQVYVFFDDTGLDVDKVKFFLDDQRRGKTDRHSHFDFKGTARGDKGKPWDTDSVSEGEHTIRAVVTYEDGTSEEVVATFTVGS